MERKKKLAANRLSANLQSGYLPISENELHSTGIRGCKLTVLLVTVTVLWILAVLTLICNVLLIVALRMQHRGMDWVQLVTAAPNNTEYTLFKKSPILIDTLAPEGLVRSLTADEFELRGKSVKFQSGLSNPELADETGGKTLPTSFELGADGTLRLVADDFAINRVDDGSEVFRLRDMELNLPGPDVMKHIHVSKTFVDRIVSQADESLAVFSPSDLTLDGNSGASLWSRRFYLTAFNGGDVSINNDIGAVRLEAKEGISVFSKGRRTIPISTSPALSADVMGRKVCFCGNNARIYTVLGKENCGGGNVCF